MIKQIGNRGLYKSVFNYFKRMVATTAFHSLLLEDRRYVRSLVENRTVRIYFNINNCMYRDIKG